MTIYGQNSQWREHKANFVRSENEGKKVKVAGWIQQKRDKGKLIFITLRDASGVCQITLFKPKIEESVWDVAKDLTLESVVSIEGNVKADPRSKLGAELVPEKITLLSKAEPKFPIDLTKKKTSTDIDTIFRYRELSIRESNVSAIMEIKSAIAAAIRSFFISKNFTEIFTPFILASGTEGGAEMFPVDYFGNESVLAQSCQFYKQAALSTHEKVFGIIPSWRAEKSHTTKHLTEFWQVENEISYATDKEIMEIQEDLIIFVLTYIQEHCSHELERINRTIKIPSKPFKKLDFYEAKDVIEKLSKDNAELDIKEGRDEDFGATAESLLSKSFEEPFFIINFPTHLRGMYYAENPEDKSKTLSLDLIAPEGFGELSSGGQRVSDYETLVRRMEEKGFDPESFDWYLRMFKYGFPPHAGYGLGFERLVRWVCGLEHVREAVMFPRTPDYFKP